MYSIVLKTCAKRQRCKARRSSIDIKKIESKAKATYPVEIRGCVPPGGGGGGDSALRLLQLPPLPPLLAVHGDGGEEGEEGAGQRRGQGGKQQVETDVHRAAVVLVVLLLAVVEGAGQVLARGGRRGHVRRTSSSTELRGLRRAGSARNVARYKAGIVKLQYIHKRSN